MFMMPRRWRRPRARPQMVETDGSARLNLTLATADYDHVRDLVHGVVRPTGIALTAFALQIEEIFFRFTKNLEWDVSEMSFAKFTALTAQGNAPMIGLPVFPSRVFRHSAFYVRSDRGIKSAKDLEGKTVGIPEWAQTAGIYARGLLAETYGVDLKKIRWVQAGVNQPGRVEKVELKLPAGVRYEARARQEPQRHAGIRRGRRRDDRARAGVVRRGQAVRSCGCGPISAPRRRAISRRPEFFRSCI